MTKFREKARAVEMRKAGYSYNEIRRGIPVAKSTLSLWLRSVGLAKKQQVRLRAKQSEMQRRAVQKWHDIRIEKTMRILKAAHDEVGRLSRRELWLVGVALYWAEGAKEHDRGVRVLFSNSDPHMIQLFKSWALRFFSISAKDIVYTLYIHSDSKRIHESIGYWSEFLSIEPHDLAVVFKKHTLSPKRRSRGVQYRGLVRLTIRKSIDLNRKIAGWIHGIISSTRVDGE